LNVESSKLNVACSPTAPNGGSPPSSVLCPPSSALTRLPGETPRAFGAFLAFYQLGQTRSHAAVADALGEQMEKMTLAQVSRAIHIGTRITADALHNNMVPDEPSASPIEAALQAALVKAFSPSSAPPKPRSSGRESAPSDSPEASACAPTRGNGSGFQSAKPDSENSHHHPMTQPTP
jgi:hypothetical protein